MHFLSYYIPCLLLFLLFISSSTEPTHFSNETIESSSWAAKPEVRGWGFSERRRLGRFQICALCTCCGGPKGICIASPCCYAINCNIPNRPFGFCSFIPKTCNCFGCHL